MAIANATTPASFGAVASLRAVKSFADVVANLKTWNDVRVTRRELSKLTDRQLQDIGLSRVDQY